MQDFSMSNVKTYFFLKQAVSASFNYQGAIKLKCFEVFQFPFGEYFIVTYTELGNLFDLTVGQ